MREEVIPGYYLCKLSTGVAYYLVHAAAHDRWHAEYNGQNARVQAEAFHSKIQIEHLLSVGSKWEAQTHKVLIIRWQDLHKTYQLDAIACRAEFREKYYEGIYGHKPTEVNNLKDQLYAAVGEASGRLRLLKTTGRHFVLEGQRIPEIESASASTYDASRFEVVEATLSGEALWGNPSERTKQLIKEALPEQQNNNMDLLNNIPGLNLNFGKLEPGRIALSMNGELAFKDKQGNYVTIQTEGTEKTRVDVGSLKFDIEFYKVPTQDLEEGDIILLDNDLLITGKKTNGEWKFINPITGATTNKLQRSNIIGMYFYTKIVSLFSMVGGEANGLGLSGLDPMMLMLMSGQGGQLGIGGGSGDIGQLLVLSQLSKAKGNSDLGSMLPLLMMSGGNGGALNGGGIGQLLLMQALSGNSGGLGNLFGKKKTAAKPTNKKTTAKKSSAKRKTQAAG